MNVFSYLLLKLRSAGSVSGMWIYLIALNSTGAIGGEPAAKHTGVDKPKPLGKIIQEEFQSTQYEIRPAATVVVQFGSGSAVIHNSKAFERRVTHLSDAAGNQKIARLHVAIWPDAEGGNGEDLTEARYASIRFFLRKTFPGIETETYDFSDPANWLERRIGVDEEAVKRKMSRVATGQRLGGNSTHTRLAKQFHKYGGPGKAVIVAEVEKNRISE